MMTAAEEDANMELLLETVFERELDAAVEAEVKEMAQMIVLAASD